MNKAVLISLRPQWNELIKSLIKKIELRKDKPKNDVPFPVLIYETKSKGGCGKVTGEFICDKIIEFDKYFFACESSFRIYDEYKDTCLSWKEMNDYVNGREILYGWHISEVKIYDKPKELSEFKNLKGEQIKRSPQSWCYVQAERKKQNE